MKIKDMHFRTMAIYTKERFHMRSSVESIMDEWCELCFDKYANEVPLKKGVKVTGATVHFVNEICDGGPIILQKAVPILQSDTPETLQRRVMEEAEWKMRACDYDGLGIYIGNGEIIHASHLVRVNSLIPGSENYYENAHRLIRACRIW